MRFLRASFRGIYLLFREFYVGFVIDISNNLVTVDHAHNDFCVTTPNGNPAILFLGDLKVTSIFSRTKGKRDRSLPGDNSPMLYALKGMHGLITRPRDIGMLCLSFRQILPVFLSNTSQWDWIVPLPSSSSVCNRFASMVQKRTQIGICQPNALDKVTSAEVLRCTRGLKISSKDKSAIHEDVKRFISSNSLETPFQIKAIKRTKLRKYINPLMWGSILCSTKPPQRILLVDDMITTGTSLVCAENIIRARYPNVRIEALTIFGSSRK